MATIIYRNAKAFINDTELDAQLTELSVDYKVEILDATTFGADTRIRKGGLYTATISGKGFFDNSGGVGPIDTLIFNNIGLDESTATSLLPTVITVFANGINEGTITDMGFAMKGVLESFMMGGGVGALLPVSFSAQARGVY